MPGLGDAYQYFHQAGATAGVSIKGASAQTQPNPGVLHAVTVNDGVAGGAITLYDGVSTSDAVIAVIGAPNTQGSSLLYDIRFNKGLFMVVANNVDVTVAFA